MRKENKTDLYNHSEVEAFWNEKWEQEKIYQPNLDTSKKPFYNLMMFPYPSSEGLHVGSFFTYAGIDAYGRFQRMKGNDVFEPIGLDGFGIHSENYAIKVGRTPQEHAEISEKNFYRQLHMIGNSYDWSRTVETYNPDYYKWTQWIFTELFKAGLAYKAKASVNFCPSCKTVLSDEQVIDGKCERCSSVVEKKELSQWFFKITDYAERLLKNTDSLDWTPKVKIAQKNWIGKKEGALVVFDVKGKDEKLEVFTTRPDTLFGATFLVIAPEHPLALSIKDPEVKEYIKQTERKSAIQRQSEELEKTGVFSGLYGVNPVNDEEIPIWISDYALMDYGTGALFGDAHDERDVEFAKKYGISLKPTLITGDKAKDERILNLSEVYTGYGTLVDSGEFSGLSSKEAASSIIDFLSKKGKGEKKTTYHLRDWLISRQRYWGPPIPMIFCENCKSKGKSYFSSSLNTKKIKGGSGMDGWYVVSKEDLPVLLPDISDYNPIGTGKSPLANHPEFYKTKCPECGSDARRETDVSDTFLDSSWYFFRYTSTDIESEAFDISRVKKWLPVTSYIGGAEHAVLHLLYSRFITMVFKDLGYIDFEEPYAKFRANGLIIKDGAKMSKSKGNVINPDEYVKKFGADTLRCYLAFIGPFTHGGDFKDSGIEGMNRFLKRVWHLVSSFDNSEVSMDDKSLYMLHSTVKGVTEDMEELRFNTAIAKLMTYYNFLTEKKQISKEEIEVLLKLLAPFAPFMTEELWQRINGAKEDGRFLSIHTSLWPSYDDKYLVKDEVLLAVQVNGKVRDVINVSIDMKEEEVKQMALKSASVEKHLNDKQILKTVYVKGKILNFVV